jgi:lipopolysaccharide export system permease protein
MIPRYDPESNILFDGEELLPSARQIRELSLRLPTSWTPWGRSVSAGLATFLPATRDRPAGYLLEGLKTAHAGSIPSYRQNNRIVIYAPSEAAWLRPDTYFVVCRLPIEAFQDGQRWRLYNSTLHLVRGVRSGELESAPDVRLAIHVRALQPFLDLSLIFLGVPFVLESQRHHFFLSAGKTILVGSIFTLVVVLCHSLGLQGMVSPYFAAWLPLLVLAPTAVLISGSLSR